jgi:hypothetical protein
VAVIDGAGIAQRFAAADNGSNTEKGQFLEQVTSEVFCSIDGIEVVDVNVMDHAGSMEVDILLFNKRTGLSIDSPYLMIECKNWAAAVDTATIRSFTSTRAECRVPLGVLVAANGITGVPGDLSAAYQHLKSEFDRNGIIVIVFERHEIESLTSTDELEGIIMRKVGRRMMNKSGFL